MQVTDFKIIKVELISNCTIYKNRYTSSGRFSSTFDIYLGNTITLKKNQDNILIIHTSVDYILDNIFKTDSMANATTLDHIDH